MAEQGKERRIDWVSMTIIALVALGVGFIASERLGGSAATSGDNVIIFDTDAYVEALESGDATVDPQDAIETMRAEAQRAADEEGAIVIHSDAIWAAPEDHYVRFSE